MNVTQLLQFLPLDFNQLFLQLLKRFVARRGAVKL